MCRHVHRSRKSELKPAFNIEHPKQEQFKCAAFPSAYSQWGNKADSPAFWGVTFLFTVSCGKLLSWISFHEETTEGGERSIITLSSDCLQCSSQTAPLKGI